MTEPEPQPSPDPSNTPIEELIAALPDDDDTAYRLAECDPAEDPDTPAPAGT